MEYISATFNNNNTSLCGRDLKKKIQQQNMIQQKKIPAKHDVHAKLDQYLWATVTM